MTGIAYPHMAPPTAASQQLSNDQKRMSTVWEIIGDMLSRNIRAVTECKERYLHVIWILQVDLYTNGNKSQKQRQPCKQHQNVIVRYLVNLTKLIYKKLWLTQIVDLVKWPCRLFQWFILWENKYSILNEDMDNADSLIYCSTIQRIC